MLNFFLNKVDAHADDLRQETFERFLRNAHTFEGRSSLRVYILGIARNVLLEYIRKKRKHQHEDLDQLSIADCGIGITSLLGYRADVQRVLHALRRLPINAQIMLELYYCERLTDREMGLMLDISPNTVRGRLARARERLRAEIERGPEPPTRRGPPSDGSPSDGSPSDGSPSDGSPSDGSPAALLSDTPVDFPAWEERIRREIFVDGGERSSPTDQSELGTPPSK